MRPYCTAIGVITMAIIIALLEEAVCSRLSGSLVVVSHCQKKGKGSAT